MCVARAVAASEAAAAAVQIDDQSGHHEQQSVIDMHERTHASPRCQTTVVRLFVGSLRGRVGLLLID